MTLKNIFRKYPLRFKIDRLFAKGETNCLSSFTLLEKVVPIVVSLCRVLPAVRVPFVA